MAFEIHVLWAGRHQRDSWEELCSGYARRIARWVPIRDRAIRVRRGGDRAQRLRDEAEALSAAVPRDALLVALDRRGRTYSSEELADEISRWRREWPHPIAFVVGSDLGLTPQVVERARLVLSFGPLTLPHELARLVLYEQVYRALSIAAGINYHRQPF